MWVKHYFFTSGKFTHTSAAIAAIRGIREIRFINKQFLLNQFVLFYLLIGFKQLQLLKIIKCFDKFSLGKPQASFHFLVNF
jgi:hypothetical protein